VIRVQVIHPFLCITESNVDSVDTSRESASVFESVDHGGISGSRVYVDKVFSSVAAPGIVSLQVALEESAIELEPEVKGSDSKHALVNNADHLKSLDPRILVKSGDDLFQDSGVELIFRVFNYIWRTDEERFPDSDKVPFSYAYDVLPTGKEQGLMEVLTNIEPLNHYSWKDWVRKYGKSKEICDLMLRSAAGSYIAAYVVGARDRHWDNVVIKDSSMLVQIDFGYVLGGQAPIEGPKFPVSPDMQKAFVEVGIWENFVDMCGKAFTSLRNNGPAVGREIYTLFRHTGLSYKKILQFLRH